MSQNSAWYLQYHEVKNSRNWRSWPLIRHARAVRLRRLKPCGDGRHGELSVIRYYWAHFLEQQRAERRPDRGHQQAGAEAVPANVGDAEGGQREHRRHQDQSLHRAWHRHDEVPCRDASPCNWAADWCTAAAPPTLGSMRPGWMTTVADRSSPATETMVKVRGASRSSYANCTSNRSRWRTPPAAGMATHGNPCTRRLTSWPSEMALEARLAAIVIASSSR